MQQLSAGIRFISGSHNLLVVAPHGPFIRGRYLNDQRTGLITEAIQHELGGCALINDLYFKPKGPIRKSRARYILDLYRRDHGRKVPGYLETIKRVVDSPGKTLVLWVHGLSDEFAAGQARFHGQKGVFEGPPRNLEGLIAFGQGGDPKRGDPRDCPTAQRQTVECFRDHLTKAGLTTLLTHPQAKNYRGRDAKRLNQWFNQLGYGFDQVESIQLEIKVRGFRDTTVNAHRTAGIIAEALQSITPAPV